MGSSPSGAAPPGPLPMLPVEKDKAAQAAGPSPARRRTLQGGSLHGVVQLWNTPTSWGARNSTNLVSWKVPRLQWKMETTWSEMYRIFPVTRDTAAANMSWNGEHDSGEAGLEGTGQVTLPRGAENRGRQTGWQQDA